MCNITENCNNTNIAEKTNFLAESGMYNGNSSALPFLKINPTFYIFTNDPKLEEI
jgi:hypothetical protein